jgi:diguanylate cyclase (GGDEF)-like protein
LAWFSVDIKPSIKGRVLSSETNVNDAMQALRNLYRKNLPEKLEEIRALWESIQQADKFDAEAFHTLHRMVHSLTGSGATFGLTEISTTARVMETTIKENLHSVEKLPADLCARINVEWEALKAAAFPPESVSVESLKGTAPGTPVAATVEPVKAVSQYSILLVEEDFELAKALEKQLLHFDYAVKVLHVPALINTAIAEMKPTVIVIDIDFLEGGLNDASAIKDYYADANDQIPLIFLSTLGDVHTRLAAVRAGAVAFVTKPIEMGVLIDDLDRLTAIASLEPFKILIVDDSPSLADYYALALQSAGMEVRVVTEPLKTLDVMRDFSPELILMDLYMPECNGLEMAKVIRQQEAYISIPIVFLSSEQNIQTQLEAMDKGADAFLTKPIQANHLVASVSARLKRYRKLRSFMVKDGLTGLLNHTKCKEELDLEMKRVQRLGSVMVFAMLDIDFFKNVNDNYGHAAGDRVLKSLSRMLQQRLRKTDIVGRYGGEEFAVILKDTDTASAFTALDEVRKAFALIAHQSDKGDFFVTFSGGLAAYPAFVSAAEIGHAADMALYEAKREGRNRVAIASATKGS